MPTGPTKKKKKKKSIKQKDGQLGWLFFLVTKQEVSCLWCMRDSYFGEAHV